MAATKYVEVDFEKLKALIEECAGNVNRAEKALGCGHAISNARRNNLLAKPVVYAIESEYGIAYSDYALVTEEVAEEDCEYLISEEVWERLEEVIISAIKKALNEQQG